MTVVLVKTSMSVFLMPVVKMQHVKILLVLMIVHVIVDIVMTVLNVTTSMNAITHIHLRVKTQDARTMMAVSIVRVLMVTVILTEFVLMTTNVSLVTVVTSIQDAPTQMVFISAFVNQVLSKTKVSRLMALLILNVMTKMNVY